VFSDKEQLHEQANQFKREKNEAVNDFQKIKT